MLNGCMCDGNPAIRPVVGRRTIIKRRKDKKYD